MATDNANWTLIDKFLLLLAHGGEMMTMRGAALEYAIAGAVLMELEKQGFIDSDQQNVILLRFDLPEDEILAKAHREIVSRGTLPIREWLMWMATRAPALRDASMDRLISKGFLAKKERRKFVVFQQQYYEATGDSGKELRRQLYSLLASQEIPVPDDIRLICLADATGLLRQMFNDEERRITKDRVEILRRLDLVGQVTAVAIEDVDFTVAVNIERRE